MTAQQPAERVASVLNREIVRLFAERRVLLACTGDPFCQGVLEGFGMVPVDLVAPPPGSFPGLRGYVLDLRLLGPETYLEWVAVAKPLPRLPPLERLEPELEAVLEHWDDADQVAASPIRELGEMLLGDEKADVDGVRQLVTGALDAARRRAPGDEQAFQAVELAYLSGTPKLEVAARRLAVSRPTFYRMRKRAVRAMVEELVRWARSGRPTPPDSVP